MIALNSATSDDSIEAILFQICFVINSLTRFTTPSNKWEYIVAYKCYIQPIPKYIIEYYHTLKHHMILIMPIKILARCTSLLINIIPAKYFFDSQEKNFQINPKRAMVNIPYV